MEHITIGTLKKLISVGFSFDDYEHFLNKGWLYYYDNDEYIIGGYSNKDFTDEEKRISENGTWIPDADSLLKWLQSCGFCYRIEWDGYYNVSAIDDSGTCFEAGGISLADSIAKLIYKICKKSNKAPVPKPILRAEITTKD